MMPWNNVYLDHGVKSREIKNSSVHEKHELVKYLWLHMSGTISKSILNIYLN